MDIKELKNLCNAKYGNAIACFENGGKVSDIHINLLETADLLIKIGATDPNLKTVCEKKSLKLLFLAKELRISGDCSKIYLLLTGEKLKEKSMNDDFDDFIKNVNLPVDNTAEEIDIRPLTLSNFEGQDNIKPMLVEAISAAKLRNEPLEHILLYGSAGLGKTTLSKIIASEMGSNIIIMSGPTIKDVDSFVQIIKNVNYGDIIFIDEIHRINTVAAESIYTVMEDFELSYMEKNKNTVENKHIKLPKFTIIGATTHSGLLEKPMRDRFPLQLKLEPYTIDKIRGIAQSTVNKLGFSIEEDAANEIAIRSRGIPRICNSFVKRIRDKAQVKGLTAIDKELVKEYFDQNGIDNIGLNRGDIDYLNTLYNKFSSGPTGLENLASALGEGSNIIENQYEPYLIYMGLIQITQKGRILTPNGIQYILK
jgi:Holliday junction DNA helicase RuvB